MRHGFIIHESQFGVGLELAVTLEHNDSSFFGFGRKYHLVAFFPHVDNECLSWEHVTCESSADLLEDHWVFLMILFKDSPRCESISAEAMEDWNLEATHF